MSQNSAGGPEAVVDSPVAPAVAPSARPSLAEAKAAQAARLAERALAAQSAPASRPSAPAPRPERVPGEGEFYCLACPKKHVVAAKNAFVHAIPWLEIHFDGVAPSFEQLAEVAVCEQAARADRRLNWYPMVPVFAEIQSMVAEKAEEDRVYREKNKARNDKRAEKAVAHAKPHLAPTAPAKKRGGTALEGFAALGKIFFGK